MARSSSSSPRTLTKVLLLTAIAVIALIACGRADPSVTPGPSASPAPTVGPSAPSSPPPTSAPTQDPAAGPITVDLADRTGHDVSVVIADETGTLHDAKSGTPGDGMSVRWFDAKVQNVDAETVRVVWVGLPRDETLSLRITADGGRYQLGIVQAAPPANSDALGADRVLDLRFDAPVVAEAVDVSIEEVGEAN